MLKQSMPSEQIHRSSWINFLWQTTRDLPLPVPLETARARLKSALASSGDGRMDGDNLEYHYSELYSRSSLYLTVNGHLSAASGGSQLQMIVRSKRLWTNFIPIIIGCSAVPIISVIDGMRGRPLLLLAIVTGSMTALICGLIFAVFMLRRWMGTNRIAEQLLNIVSDPPPLS